MRWGSCDARDLATRQNDQGLSQILKRQRRKPSPRSDKGLGRDHRSNNFEWMKSFGSHVCRKPFQILEELVGLFMLCD